MVDRISASTAIIQLETMLDNLRHHQVKGQLTPDILAIVQPNYARHVRALHDPGFHGYAAEYERCYDDLRQRTEAR